MFQDRVCQKLLYFNDICIS